jgi:anti-sigma B factor antagonist
VTSLGPDDAVAASLSDEPLRMPFVLTGEIDIANADLVGAQLTAYAEAAAGDVVVDCATLTFIDSTGIAALMRVHRSLLPAGRRLRLVGLSGSPRRVFEITGLVALLAEE